MTVDGPQRGRGNGKAQGDKGGRSNRGSGKQSRGSVVMILEPRETRRALGPS